MARLKEGERIDDLERNGYRIIQHPEKFCFGMDAVLLTGFARARRSDRLLDLGTGTGIIPLLMEAKYGCAHLTGLEIQAESADMAERSVELNGLSDRIEIVTGDIKEADHLFPSASFDCITCNPPYMIGQHGIANPDAPKAIARHEILCTFSDVAAQAEKLLKPGGHFFLVHRPFRLAEIITELVRRRLEPKRMQLVYPYVDREPNMVLLEAVRGGRPRMTVEILRQDRSGKRAGGPVRLPGISGSPGRSREEAKRGPAVSPEELWRMRGAGPEGRGNGGNIISMCDTDWESAGHDAQSRGDLAGGGRDCGRRHAQQRQAAEPFRHPYAHDQLPRVQ